MTLNPIEIGLSVSLIVVVVLIVRLSLNPAMNEATKTRSVAELKREIEVLKGAQESLAHDNQRLRNLLETCQQDSRNAYETLAALRGEMGRTTK